VSLPFAAPIPSFEDDFALYDHVSDDAVAFLGKLFRAVPEAIVGEDPRVHLSGE